MVLNQPRSAPARARRIRPALGVLLAAATLIALAVAGALYAGLYNVAADDPHWGITTRVMQLARARSIEARSRDIAPPNLDDQKLLLKGAGQYAEMCVNCHLAPDMRDSPTRQGLYPKPPNLAQGALDPREAFWIIKHGVKMTGMPAWGASHDDETIWSLVAFVKKLPGLSSQQYKQMVDAAPKDEEMSPMPGMDHGAAGHSEGAPMAEPSRK